MQTFLATAKHTTGASVAHACVTGTYADPTDWWSCRIIADSRETAEWAALDSLAEYVDDYGACGCCQHMQPGCKQWWDSVRITLADE